MDSGKGHFDPIDTKKFQDQFEKLNKLEMGALEEKDRSTGVFREGEILEIRTSRFRIERIDRKKMVLKLLPKLKTT